MVKKSFVIKCGSLCEELAKRISEEGVEFSNVEIHGEVMRIYFSDEILSPENEIREIKRIWSEIASTRSLERKFSIKRIQRITGPVIPEVLVEILRLRGFKASYKEDYIETNADYDTVIAISSSISRCIKELAFARNLTTTAKRVTVFACAYHDVSAESAIEALKRENILVEAEEGSLQVSTSDLEKIYGFIARELIIE